MAGVKGKGGPKPAVPFSLELMEQIFERIALGNTIAEICDTAGMPPADTVRTWIAKDREGCYNAYARAKELQMEWWTDHLLEIADDSRNDYMEGLAGSRVFDPENVQRSRVRIDTRKWLMSKLAPRRYGDKLEHSGGVTIRHEDDLEKLK